jgi:hypothetical protein
MMPSGKILGMTRVVDALSLNEISPPKQPFLKLSVCLSSTHWKYVQNTSLSPLLCVRSRGQMRERGVGLDVSLRWFEFDTQLQLTAAKKNKNKSNSSLNSDFSRVHLHGPTPAVYESWYICELLCSRYVGEKASRSLVRLLLVLSKSLGM